MSNFYCSKRSRRLYKKTSGKKRFYINPIFRNFLSFFLSFSISVRLSNPIPFLFSSHVNLDGQKQKLSLSDPALRK